MGTDGMNSSSSNNWVNELSEERDAILRETALEKDDIQCSMDADQRIICYRTRPNRRRSMGDTSFSFENSRSPPRRRMSNDPWLNELMEERKSTLLETDLMDSTDTFLDIS